MDIICPCSIGLRIRPDEKRIYDVVYLNGSGPWSKAIGRVIVSVVKQILQVYPHVIRRVVAGFERFIGECWPRR